MSHRRLKPTLMLLLVAIVATCIFAAPAGALALPKRGSGGWYWPTGSENFGGMDGYWTHRSSNDSWHLAQDMRAPVGAPIYAIADGVVAESSPDSGYGGVLVIWHKTGDGEKFLAVYGHIKRENLKKGDKVIAGHVIGHVNSAAHCHFGIHPGDSYPPDGNPYRGHTYDSSQTYGWVDPVKFLRTHPAALPKYSAPALPLVSTTRTEAAATVLGSSSGSIYWSIASDDDSPTIYTRVLPSGPVTEVASDTALPAFDTTRYLASVTATGFCLYDRLPVVAAWYSERTPAWAAPITIKGAAKNAVGKAFGGAKITLERSYDSGTSWKAVATATTTLKGTYSIGFAPDRACTLRARFAPPNTYLPTASAGVTVAPEPGLSVPTSTQSRAGKPTTISGTIATRQKAGSHLVTLLLQTFSKSKGWVDTYTAQTVTGNAPGNTSTYSATIGPLPPGAYRVRASCSAGSKYAAQTTAWVHIKAK